MGMYELLNEEVQEVNILNEMFKPMLESADAALKKVMNEVYGENFQGGEITIKLKIEIPEDYQEIPTVNDDGEIIPIKYRYKTPVFDYKVNTTLNKKYKADGSYRTNKELIEEDGVFKLRPLEEHQVKMDDVIRSE